MLDRPPLIERMHGAPADVFRAAPEEEQAAAQAWINERRGEARARKAAKRARTLRIASLASSGDTIDDIAKEIGISPRSIERACAAIGLRLGRASSRRRVVVTPIAPDQADALDALAADYGATRDATIARALRYLLDDDAFIARRIMRVSRAPGAQQPLGAEDGDRAGVRKEDTP